MGVTCQAVTGGGVSHELPEAERRLCPAECPAEYPEGGVPMINCTCSSTNIKTITLVTFPVGV